jgi:hypothetical protein
MKITLRKCSQYPQPERAMDMCDRVPSSIRRVGGSLSGPPASVFVRNLADPRLGTYRDTDSSKARTKYRMLARGELGVYLFAVVVRPLLPPGELAWYFGSLVR